MLLTVAENFAQASGQRDADGPFACEKMLNPSFQCFDRTERLRVHRIQIV